MKIKKNLNFVILGLIISCFFVSCASLNAKSQDYADRLTRKIQLMVDVSNDYLESWHGEKSSDLIIKNGTPTYKTNLDGGKELYEYRWNSSSSSAQLMEASIINFIVKDNIIIESNIVSNTTWQQIQYIYSNFRPSESYEKSDKFSESREKRDEINSIVKTELKEKSEEADKQINSTLFWLYLSLGLSLVSLLIIPFM